MAIALGLVINRFVDEAYLVEQIEASINSKAEIGKVELSLFRSPARLTLHDVQLSAKPGDEKTGDARVKIEAVDLQVSLWALLHKRIEVSNMTVRGAHVTGTVYKKGGSSLEAPFESPDRKKKHRRSGKKAHGKKGSKGKKEGGGFNVFDQEDFVASLGGFFIEDSSVDLTLEKSGLRIRCSDVNIGLGAIEIDPRRLEATDKATLTMSVKVRLDSTKGWHYGDLDISGQAISRIFNQETGDMEPDVEGEFALGESSWLNTKIPVITEAWQQLDKLKSIGLRIDPLPEKATFGRSEAVAAHYHRGKITIRKSLSLWVADWEVAAVADSWLQTETNQHVIHAEVMASKNASEKLYGFIVKTIDYLPGEARDIVSKDLRMNLFREDRFFVRIKSTGELSKPKIRLVDGVPDFLKAAEKAGKELLLKKAGGFLDGLLGE